ncbi:gp35 [Synechococcus phage Syn5]|uniref:Gp35 n=1 Tax=Synechococcus phage Syn5 TaxID=2914003 RepID=A4ZRB6_9CAUD|nr:gp35 [Synechococcus phage Syn5]ABP87942.1 gp35 [Synechococcus phage Syn5]
MADLSREEIFGTGEFLPKLIEELDSVFPQVSPSPGDELSQIMYRSGQRSVVEFLINKLEQDNV